MKRTIFVLSLIVIFAVALVLGIATAASGEGEPDTEWWQVRTIPTPVASVTPSFVSSTDGKLAWTGAKLYGLSNMYMFDLVTGTNKVIPTGTTGNYYNPSADGSWVVFQGARAGAYDDIWLYEIDNGELRQITTNADKGDTNDWNPRIDNGRIVWEKDMTGSTAAPGIYLYDIDNATLTCIIPGDGYRNPDISGDYVVCAKPSGNGAEIVLYNLKTKELKTIATAAKSNEDPRIDSGRVVWSSGDIWTANNPDVWMTYQIMLYDIATGTTTALTNNVASNTKPSIKGGVIAWLTKEPSSIYVVNQETNHSGPLSSQGDEVGAPEVDGEGISWYGTKGLYYAVPTGSAGRFPDVPADHPYYTAIEQMADKEIIEGYDNGNFGLTDLVTRQQFAKMILLTMAISNPTQYTATENDTPNFTDNASILHQEGELYAFHYVARAALTGLTKGYPDGSFKPANNISRQQVITMIVRAGSSVLEPPPSNWQGQLSYTNEEHGARIRLAEYNGLLTGIVGPQGTLTDWDTTQNATRGEVAQMLYNLMNKMTPPAPSGQ